MDCLKELSLQERARGMLVGLVVGDALGAPVEFGYTSEKIKALGDRISHYHETPFGPAGTWTDDTSMALCIADSLIACDGYNSYDIMKNFLLWATNGYRTHDDQPAADIGAQTRHALEEFVDNPIVKNSNTTTSAGNGPIMRLAPIIITNTFLEDGQSSKISESKLQTVINMAILSCRETHNSTAAECVTAMFAATLYAAICGLDKNSILEYASHINTYLQNKVHLDFLEENKELIVDRWQKENDGNDLKDLGGYIVDAYAIALWGFVNSESFKEGMLKVVCLGGDTDTNAATYGQLAGAYYGYEAIPQEWREDVYLGDEITQIADRLLAKETCPIICTRFEDDENFRSLEK